MMDFFDTAFGEVERLPVWALSVVVSLVIGFTLKKTKQFPNGMIPLGVIVFGTAASVAIRYGFGRFIVEGMVYSGTAWMFHKFIWKSLIARFPLVKTNPHEFDSNPELKRDDKDDG